MIEKEILDRVPQNPGQITLEPVDGIENTFVMKRADNPKVEGTPINKATLDSIIYSRLTGRYYEPTVERTQTGALSGIKVNPIPESGWTNATEYGAKKGGYELITPNPYSNDLSTNIVDGNSATYWLSEYITNPYIIVKFPDPIIITKLIANISLSNGDSATCIISGSNDNKTWTQLHSFNFSSPVDTVRTLKTPGEYMYYKLSVNAEQNLNVYNFAVSEYSVKSYVNTFMVEKFPEIWTKGQRATIEIPETASGVGVTENTLNGIKVNTILQAGKRYELTYNGTAFDTKEM
jgi:hypothetical protein